VIDHQELTAEKLRYQQEQQKDLGIEQLKNKNQDDIVHPSLNIMFEGPISFDKSVL